MRARTSFRASMPAATFTALVAGALLAAAPWALGMTDHTASEKINQQRARALQSAATSAIQAIEAAEQLHGKAFFIRFELLRGKPYYLLRTSQNGQEWIGWVDANSRQLVGQGRTYPASKLAREDVQSIHAMQSAPISLREAVRAAQRLQPDAKVLQATLLTNHTGQAHYDVYLVQNGRVRVAMINPQNGQPE